MSQWEVHLRSCLRLLRLAAEDNVQVLRALRAACEGDGCGGGDARAQLAGPAELGQLAGFLGDKRVAVLGLAVDLLALVARQRPLAQRQLARDPAAFAALAALAQQTSSPTLHKKALVSCACAALWFPVR